MKRPHIFLDRDGVINRAVVRDGRPYPPASLGEMEILEGVADALKQLREAGFRLVVVTNQPDVARGTQSRGEVDEIHNELLRLLPLDDIRSCFHDNSDHCICRKPLPGLLLEKAEEVDYTSSYMIGDRWRDVDAGNAAGCRTIFIDYGYQEKQPAAYDYKTDSLTNAAKWICTQITGEPNEH